jgi:hypothetical protein
MLPQIEILSSWFDNLVILWDTSNMGENCFV